MELYRIVGIVAAAATMLGGAERRPQPQELLVAAAASLSVVAPQLAHAFSETSGNGVRFNFAGSNTLARQIIEGAQVDAFISADERQMDVVEKAGRVVPGTRVEVVSNQLVLIATLSPGQLQKVEDLVSSRVQRVAMGDPAAVPAGVYGRRWLQDLALWPQVSTKVVPLPSSPAVVAAVAAGRAQAGIVYRSDVTHRQDARDVRVVHSVPPGSGPRIVYPGAAIVSGRVAIARQFLAFLRSDPAQTLFDAAGFLPLNAR
jgi:molybdate transport system substrate-binding protein